MLDLTSNVALVQSIAPQVIDTDTATNGAAADLSNYNSAVVVFDIGTVTDGTYTPTVEEALDGSTWTTVAAADLSGTLVAVTTANDPKIQKVGYMGSAGQIRAVITSASTTSGGPMGATIVLSHMRRTAGDAYVS